MKFTLNTKIINPEESQKIKNAIILFHGYGGSGIDISMVTVNWKRFLPNTIFLCPDGHEICSINPSGFQWFDLSKDDPNYIIEQSLLAEKVINTYINEIKDFYNLSNSQICLSGFSQGCMISINVGLTSIESFNCIVGFSGKIINKKNLEDRIISNTKIFLLHGDMDPVVPSSNLLDAKDFFLRKKIEIQTKMISNCEHYIPVEASSAALNYIKKNFKI
tara:strand:- start:636 stop:1292 length:657 start_codon:yes stop_codon:yes gene_type:complete